MLEIIKTTCINNSKFLICVCILIVIDTILGVSKAIQNDDFKFSSNGFRKCIPKTLQYFCMVIVGITLEITFGCKTSSIFSIIIIITELISIKENLSSIPIINNILSNIIDSIKYKYKIIDNDVINNDITDTNDTTDNSL